MSSKAACERERAILALVLSTAQYRSSFSSSWPMSRGSFHLNLESYYTYGEPPFDLSIFDQGMWLISHFHVRSSRSWDEISLATMRRSCCISSRRSSDSSLSRRAFLVLQTLLLAAPAIPIYILARKYIKSTVIATALVAIYLLSPLLQQGNLDQFHPEAFQVLIMSLRFMRPLRASRRCLS